MVALRHLRLHLWAKHEVARQVVGWASLSRLQWLDVRSNCEYHLLPADLRHNLSQLTELRHLRLECKDTQLPDISSLRLLTCLDLGTCQSLAQLPQLSGLVQLQSLNVHFCGSLHTMNGISSLTGLQQLNLHW